MTTQQPVPTQQTAQQQADDFKVINPPMLVYEPAEEEQQLQGIIVGRVQHPMTGAAFYVLQLTRPCAYLADKNGDAEAEPGAHVVVWESLSLVGLQHHLPQFTRHPQVNAEICQLAWEVIISPWAKLTEASDFGWQYLCKVRQLSGPGKLAGIRRPATFPNPDVIATRQELGLAPPPHNPMPPIDVLADIITTRFAAKMSAILEQLPSDQVEKIMEIAKTVEQPPDASASG